MPKLAAENARDDEPMAKEEQEDRVKIEDGHDKKRQGVALGGKPGVALQHEDDDKMGKQTGSNGTKTHAEAMSSGWMGDFSWINDDMRDKKSTSMSSSGNDNLKGDAEGPTKRDGQRLKVCCTYHVQQIASHQLSLHCSSWRKESGQGVHFRRLHGRRSRS